MRICFVMFTLKSCNSPCSEPMCPVNTATVLIGIEKFKHEYTVLPKKKKKVIKVLS